MRLNDIGGLSSLITLCELGDVERLSASRKAVRMAGTLPAGLPQPSRLPPEQVAPPKTERPESLNRTDP